MTFSLSGVICGDNFAAIKLIQMKHKVDTSWKGNMQFEALVNGHSIMMDAKEESGGMDAGPRPKELMLSALAGCTGMDVVAILGRMRIQPSSFNIIVEAEVTEEHPKHYTSMHIIYEFEGDDLDEDKLRKAIELSQEKYCGVSAVYKKAMPVSYDIRIKSNAGLVLSE